MPFRFFSGWYSFITAKRTKIRNQNGIIVRATSLLGCIDAQFDYI